MLRMSKLDELALNMPVAERKELLGKIAERLRHQRKGDVTGVEMSREERQTLIAEDVSKVSPLVRVVIWLKSVLSGKDPVDIFVSRKLLNIKRNIRRVYATLVDFEAGKLTSQFARRLYDLYCRAFPLLPFFRPFAQDTEFRNTAFASLMDTHYSDKKEQLESFLSSEETEKMVSSHQPMRDIESKLIKRMHEHLRNTPKEAFSMVEDELSPFIFVERIVLFSFSVLFRNFAFDVGEALEKKYPPFDSVSVRDLLNLLEQLAYCMYLAKKIPRSYLIQEELVKAYLHMTSQGEDTDEAKSLQEALDQTRQAVAALVEEARKFDRVIPLLDIIRYFRRDPYYMLVFKLPRVSIKTGYAATLRENLIRQMKEKVLAIRSRKMDQKIEQFFEGEELTNLFHL